MMIRSLKLAATFAVAALTFTTTAPAQIVTGLYVHGNVPLVFGSMPGNDLLIAGAFVMMILLPCLATRTLASSTIDE